MKRSLLSFIVLALMAVGVNAQTWTKPTVTGVVEPFAVALEDHLTSADDLAPSLPVEDAVYFYNVAGEGFLGGGNSWGTRASFKVSAGGDNRPDLPYFIADVTDKYNETIALSVVEGEKVYFLYSTGSKTNYMIFRDDATNCWVDLGSQTHNGWYWRIEQNGKYYRIKSPKTHPTFGEDFYPNWEYEYLGWNGKDDNNMISANIDPREEGVGVDWLIISPEGLAAYKDAAPLVDARLALYNQAKIVVEENLGEYGVSYEEYTEVYNGTDVAAITAATEELAAKVVEARKAKAWATGSDENPSDVTFLLVNPNFNGNMDGWTIDVPNGQNKQYQSATYKNDIEGDPNYGVTISGFIEAWLPSGNGGLGTGKIFQNVELPLGKYILGVDVMATNQAESDLEMSRETVEGLQLYALGGGIDNGVDVRSRNGKPEHYDFEFITAGGTTELGLRMVNATANWFGADNFTLKYKGNDIDPFYFALPALVESCDEIDVEEKPVNAEVKDAYIEALDAARNLVGEEEGDFEGVYNALVAAKDALFSSIADYEKLTSLVDRVSKDVESYENIESLTSMLGELLDTYQGALEDGTATGEEIAAWIEAYDAKLLEAITAAMPEATEESPLRVSIFGKNLDYADNAKEPWECASSAYKVNYHNGEVWQASFSCLQTIANMPAGKYTIKAKAFYRDASNADHYNNYMDGVADITTYLVANSNKEKVPALALAAVEGEAPEGSAYTETSEGSGIWMPNSQQAAEWAFNNTDFFNCEVSTYLPTDGDLVFGTRNDEITDANNQWSVWTQFEIYYLGKSQSALYEQLQDLIEQGGDLQNQRDYTLITEGNERLDKALNDALAVTESAGEDAIVAAIEALEDAMDYVREGKELLRPLDDTRIFFEDLWNNNPDIDSQSTTFTEIMEAINASMSSEVFESNEQIQEWLDNLPKAWVDFVMGQDMSGASVDEPFDITAILLNADFEAAGSTREQAPPYWDVDALGKNNGFQNNNTYSNADESITLSNFLESWTPSGYLADGKLSQTLLAALPEGFYRLEVDGKSSATATGVTLGVTDGSKTWEEPVATDEPTHFGVDFESDGTSVLTVGIFVKETNCTWIAFDNFQLFYIGTTAPDAIEGVVADEESITSPVAIYNLAGQRVSKATKGIFIINGKKVVVK